ncbi:MAG: cyclodeaminase/cyclohydrolase family protein [Chloroflexaceae bacterium]|nr:cyclodeaminase/cyclohydrolase family protein [Chloroflexaceae bacterium]
MEDRINEQSINTFLNNLASHAPAPGGGSVAALTGAMAAGLLSMTCAILLRKELAPEVAEELEFALRQAETTRQTLQQLAQEDVTVFEHLSAAYKLPRTTDADAATRKAAIQKLTRDATEVPMQTAHAAASLLPLCTLVVHHCTRMVVSDVGIAALLAQSTVQSAVLNVDINLALLQDKLYKQEILARIEDLTVGLAEETTGVLELVKERILN